MPGRLSAWETEFPWRIEFHFCSGTRTLTYWPNVGAFGPSVPQPPNLTSLRKLQYYNIIDRALSLPGHSVSPGTQSPGHSVSRALSLRALGLRALGLRALSLPGTRSPHQVGVMGYQNISYCIGKTPRKVSGPQFFLSPVQKPLKSDWRKN